MKPRVRSKDRGRHSRALPTCINETTLDEEPDRHYSHCGAPLPAGQRDSDSCRSKGAGAEARGRCEEGDEWECGPSDCETLPGQRTSAECVRRSAVERRRHLAESYCAAARRLSRQWTADHRPLVTLTRSRSRSRSIGEAILHFGCDFSTGAQNAIV